MTTCILIYEANLDLWKNIKINMDLLDILWNGFTYTGVQNTGILEFI